MYDKIREIFHLPNFQSCCWEIFSRERSPSFLGHCPRHQRTRNPDWFLGRRWWSTWTDSRKRSVLWFFSEILTLIWIPISLNNVWGHWLTSNFKSSKIWIMFLFYVLSFFNKGDTIQGGTLFKFPLELMSSNSTMSWVGWLLTDSALDTRYMKFKRMGNSRNFEKDLAIFCK